MLNRFLVILAASVNAWSGAYAANVNTQTCALEVCKQAQVELRVRIKSLEAATMPTFLPMVTKYNIKPELKEQYCNNLSNYDGICLMNQETAKNYCAEIEAHLPSAREWAQYAKKEFGAKGIEATCGNDDNCYHIEAENLDGKIDEFDEFNFSYSGYIRPEGDLGNNWFWSSSVVASSPDFGFYFSGVNGVVGVNVFNRGSSISVRCVAGR